MLLFIVLFLVFVTVLLGQDCFKSPPMEIASVRAGEQYCVHLS